MLIRSEDVAQLTNEIWTTMLGLEVRPNGAAGDPGQRRHVSACVQISGAWSGAVRLVCSSDLARLAAARFLAVEPVEVNDEQIRDALGELTNMSAGSVKALLPKPSHLSLPSVADGTDYRITIPGSEMIQQTCF